MPANPTNQANHALQEHAPAQMVGGMRVRAATTTHLRRRSSGGGGGAQKEDQDEEHDDNNHSNNEERRQENQQRQRAYQTARSDAHLPRHSHQPRIDPSFQPRDMNH
ncbi:unnamed protein product [Absidia cylindrospora]